MTHSIDLADPRTDRLMPYAEEPEAAIGGLAPSGPAAEQEAAVTLSVAKAEQAAMGMNFGTRALQRLQQARPGSDDWLGRDLAQTQREFDQLGPLAREVAWSVGPALKEGTLRNALRGFEARTQGASGTWFRFLDTASAYVAAGGSPEAVRPALESGLGMMAKVGLLPPDDPAANQLLDDTLIAGRVRYLAARDPDAAEAYLAASAASPQANQLLTAEVGTVRRQRLQAEQAAFSKQLREQYRTMEGPGVPGPELPAEGFHRLYGPEEGERRHQVYRGQRARAAQRQAIRGRPPGEVARLRTEASDPQAFDAATAEDEAARRADPAGYVQAYDPLLTDLPPQDAEAQAWAAQSRAGIPPGERRPWSLARVDTLAKDWLALPPEQRAGWLQATLGGLPEEQRTAGIAQLAAAGLDQGSPGLLRATFEALRGHRRATAEAYARRISSEPPAMPEGRTGVQVADSAHIRSDGTGEIWIDVPSKPTQPIAERPEARETGWRARGLPSLDSPEGWTAPVYTPERQAAITENLSNILDLRSHPEMLADIEADIQVLYADDPLTRDRFLGAARNLANPPTGEAAADHRPYNPTWSYNGAVNTIEEARALASDGKSYDAGWAYAQENLAKLEEETGYLVRPIAEGMVGFYIDGDAAPFYATSSTVAMTMARDLDAATDDLDLLALLASGLSDEDVKDLAEDFVRVSAFPIRYPLPVDGEDRSVADAILAAHEALKLRPDLSQEILDRLYLVLQAQRGQDFDYAGAIVEGLLELSDVASLGIDGYALVEAVRAGDTDAAIEAGLNVLLDGTGLLPVGRIGKAILGPLLKFGRSVKAQAKAARDWFREVGSLPPPDFAFAGAGQVDLGKMGKADEFLAPNHLAMDNGQKPIPQTREDYSDTSRIKKLSIQGIMYRRNLATNIKIMIGDDLWKSLSKEERGFLAGWLGKELGNLSEEIYRPAMKNIFERDGYDIFPKEMNLWYNGQLFRIDYVGVKKGAKPTTEIGLNTVRIDGNRYFIEDVKLADSKYGSAEFSNPQLASIEFMKRENAGFKGVEVISPLPHDLMAEDIVAIVNNSPILKDRGIEVTVAMARRLQETTFARAGRKMARMKPDQFIAAIIVLALKENGISFGLEDSRESVPQE